MAHNSDYSRIYVSASQGLSFAEISRALNSSSGDLGTLCTSSNIKKWAKYKPLRSSTLGMTGEHSGNNYWRGDGKCGMSIVVSTELGVPTTYGSFLYKLLNDELRWAHDAPTGNINVSPYRALDFDGYVNTAESPIVGLLSDTVMVSASGEITIAFDYDTPTGGDGRLNYTDLAIDGTSLADFYPGVILYKSSSDYVVATSSTKFTGADFQVIISGMQNKSGTYKCCPFFSNRAITPGGQLSTGKYLSCDIAPIDITVVPHSSLLTVYTYGLWNSINTSVSFDCEIRNEGTIPHTFTDLEIAIYSTTAGQAPGEGTLVTQFYIPQFTLGAGARVTKTGTMYLQRNSSLTYWIKAFTPSAPSSITTDWNQIEDSMDI